MTHTCPECGSPHTSEQGVVLHMMNKDDDDHAHVEDMADGWAVVLDADTSPPRDADLDSGDVEDDAGGVEVIHETPDVPDAGGGEQDGDGGCPSCGSAEWFDPAEAYPEDHEARRFDRVCADCMEGYDG